MRQGFLLLCLCGLPALAQDIEGVWHAAVGNSAKQEAAFQLELRGDNGALRGALVNGPDKQWSTSGSFHNGKLRLEFNYWDGVLEATLRNGKWRGEFRRQYRKRTLIRPFRASRRPLFAPRATPRVNAQGTWLLDVTDDKGKHSVYRAIFQQEGARLSAALAPVSGDSGTLTGFVDGRRLMVSGFDGIRTTLLKASITSSGIINGTLDTTSRVTGRRADQSNVQPPDAMHYTRLKEEAQGRFRFAYPDLDGNSVTSEDARFGGKVVIVTITGSWCPNCHEEAPLLQEMYMRHRGRGLEVVAIAFEYTGDAARDLRQLRLFAEKHGLRYPLLYAGSTEEAESRLPLENFGAYPTTIFIGRDGRVRAIHAGFDGAATGELHRRMRDEIDSLVERLLSEN